MKFASPAFTHEEAADRDPSRWQNPFFDSLYGLVRPGVRFSY